MGSGPYNWKYTDDKVWTIIAIATLPLFYIFPELSKPAYQSNVSDSTITLMVLYVLLYAIGIAITAYKANEASGYPPKENRRKFNLLQRINWLEDEVEGRTIQGLGKMAPNLKHQPELDYLKEKYKSKLGGLSSVRKSHKKQQQAYAQASQTEGNAMLYGTYAKEVVCPHCQTKGKVRKTTKELTEESREKGIIGATIGRKTITKKGSVTQLHCDNCDVTWTV